MRFRKIFGALVVGLCSTTTFAQDAPVDSSSVNRTQNDVYTDTILQPIVVFEPETIDVGTLSDDTIITRKFNFKNVGNDSLKILSVTADCSCTIPDYISGSIGPGEFGSISVQFNSTGNAGRFIQYVTVLHNAGDGYTFLVLKGFVEKQL